MKKFWIVILAIVAIIIASGMKMFWVSELPFDSATWKNISSRADDTRYRMHWDLLEKHDLVGMTREQVVELLGEPEPKEGGSLSVQGTDMVYFLGPEPGAFSIDTIWLIVHTSKGAVIGYAVRTD